VTISAYNFVGIKLEI